MQGHDAFGGREVDLKEMGTAMLQSETSAFSDHSLLVPSVQDLLPDQSGEKGDTAVEPLAKAKSGESVADDAPTVVQPVKGTEGRGQGYVDINLLRNNARRQASASIRQLRTACGDAHGKMENALDVLSPAEKVAHWREVGLLENRRLGVKALLSEGLRPLSAYVLSFKLKAPIRQPQHDASEEAPLQGGGTGEGQGGQCGQGEDGAEPAGASGCGGGGAPQTPRGVAVAGSPGTICLRAPARSWSPCNRYNSWRKTSSCMTRRQTRRPSQDCSVTWRGRRPCRTQLRTCAWYCLVHKCVCDECSLRASLKVRLRRRMQEGVVAA